MLLADRNLKAQNCSPKISLVFHRKQSVPDPTRGYRLSEFYLPVSLYYNLTHEIQRQTD